MLFQYQQETQRLIRDTRQEQVEPADIVTFINEARGQLAGESDCIVQVGNLTLDSPTQVYPFSGITFAPVAVAGSLLYDNGGALNTDDGTYPASGSGAPGSIWSNGGEVNVVLGGISVPGAPVYFGSVTSAQLLALGGLGLPTSDPQVSNQLWNQDGRVLISVGTEPGIAGTLKVRTLWYSVGTGQLWIRPRPWPWFSLYELSNPVPSQGPPKVWAQYGQGASGTIYISPLPDIAYTVQADCICYPSPLATDNDPEVIPYQWTDCIPYYAAYLALLSMETPLALQQADKMYQRYGEYVARARKAATSPVLPGIYAQQPNAARVGQLGTAPQARGAQ